MRLILAAALALAAGSALSQPGPAAPTSPRVYDLAPWWMDKPIIASTG